MFSILQNVERSSETHTASCSLCTGGSFFKKTGSWNRSPLSGAKIKTRGVVPLLPPYAFKVWTPILLFGRLATEYVLGR